MTEYADSVEPFVGPTVGGPSSPDTAYNDFKAGVVKAQQDSEAQLARRSETPFGQFLDMLGTGMMALPAGPLKVPSSRGAASVPAPPRSPAASDQAAGELHEVLGRREAAATYTPREEGVLSPNARVGRDFPPDDGTNVVPLRQNEHGEYVPYEILKASRDRFTPADNSNVPGGKLFWRDNREMTGREDGIKGQPDHWHVSSSGGNVYGSVIKAPSKEGGPPEYHASTFDPGERYSMRTGMETFQTLKAAKAYLEGHITGEPESANVLRAREAFSSIEGGAVEQSRFEHPAAETMPGDATKAGNLHEILGDQPMSRQGMAKSDAPLETRTNALIEGIDRAIEQGKKIRASVNSYVGAAYKTLNAIHRRGTPDQLDKLGFSKSSIGGQEGDVKYRDISDHLDRAISKTRLPADALLYRGVGQTLAGELADLKPGQTITDKAFMSTSRREQVANGFASGSGILRTLIEIRAPKGMPALDLGLLSTRNVEQEVVLPRNTELRYIGRTSRFNKNLTPVYQFEVVPSWESESSPRTIDSSTRTARGSSSSTPTGDLPTSSVRRPRPSYRPSPPSESRSKFGDARESLMFYPPERAPRPFQEDFPSGAQHEGSGIITRDPEGRPLTAPFVAGRNVVGGANQPIPEARYDTITARLLGKAAENVPPGKNPGSVGVTNFNTETGTPLSIELNNNLSPKARPLVYAHEIGHVLDQFAGEIPIAGIEKELYRLFNSLNNPIRTRGGNDAHPWSPRMTPRKQGYAKDEAPREMMAEAARAYMQNPNYIKAEAPNVAARIRAYVNEHPWIKQTIQFNSLAGLGIIATEHDEQ